MLGELGEGVVLGDQDVGKRLVVAQDHIVARLQLLDEIGLEEKRLGLGRGGDEFHGGGERDHRRDAVRVAAEAGIVRHPVAEIAGLADIEDVALGIVHAVDAGLAGKPRCVIADDLRPRRALALGHRLIRSSGPSYGVGRAGVNAFPPNLC